MKEKSTDQKPAKQATAKASPLPVGKSVEKPAAKAIKKPADKAVTKAVEKPVRKPAEPVAAVKPTASPPAVKLPPIPPTQRSYGPQQGQHGFGGGSGKSQKSAAHRLGKSRKVH